MKKVIIPSLVILGLFIFSCSERPSDRITPVKEVKAGGPSPSGSGAGGSSGAPKAPVQRPVKNTSAPSAS